METEEKLNEASGLLQPVQNGKEKETATPTEVEQEDIIQKCIGVLGRWHIWLCFVIFLVKFGVSWHQLSIVFLAPPINYYCINNATDKCLSNCTHYQYDTSIFTNTISMEWDLVCSKSYLLSLTQTLTMLGILVGNMLFGFLSDKFGRKLPLVLAVALQGLSGLGAAFSPWFALFLILKFLSAVATGGTMITSFVLIMEIIGTEWRTVLGILYQIPFNLGHLLMPLFSYYLRNWRHFQIMISIPSLFLISYYWILPESPRWQLAVGKEKQAIETLKKAAKRNKLPTEKIEQDVNLYLEHKRLNQKEEIHQGNILDLVRTPIMRVYTIAVGFNWFVCGLCFFGVSQFIGQLGGNIFVNVAISAVIQVPSTIFACYATKAWGRKKSLLIANIVSGLSIFIMGFVPSDLPWARTMLSSIGMFGLALSFPTVYIYSGELFPTVVRNIGVGTSSMCARIGSMIAPFVATLGNVEPWIPPVIFGIVPLIGAILCLKLPETLDCKLPDTIEEAEALNSSKHKPSSES
ncbi:organic cation transporter protein-like isoform X1 [Diabrotica undecimpunctata]|uniref:organic cation transporter protein-like isoform X1 n=1 Tax=Diabrotica undecimpunctata TaxID=50387 RepID=UPI003B63E66C